MATPSEHQTDHTDHSAELAGRKVAEQHSLTAGMLSTAKTTSLSSTTARTSSRGVATLLPFCIVKNDAPSYVSLTGMRRLQMKKEMRRQTMIRHTLYKKRMACSRWFLWLAWLR